MNYIEKIRAGIRKDFDEKTFSKGDFYSSLSPTLHYRLDATNYCTADQHCDYTKVELYDQRTGGKSVEFFVNDSQFFYSWLTKGDTEYFICAEDIFGGQTVVNLAHAEVAGYSPDKDGFIWTDFHLSPDGNTLATIGCFWACSFVIKLFDFSNPMILPLREINEIPLTGNDEVITGWKDNETIITKGFKRTYEKTVNGNYTGRILSEEPEQRYVNINSTEQQV